MNDLEPTSTEPATTSPGLVTDLMVEVFLARGAAHHDDLHEAAAELRELFACLGVLTEENAALIERKVVRLEHRRGRAALRLVPNHPRGDAALPEPAPAREATEEQFPLPLPEVR